MEDNEERKTNYLGSKTWWKGGSFTFSDTLKKTAAALENHFNYKIEIKPWEDAVAHTDMDERKITIGTKGIYTYGTDYYVGLLLHELAHLRHTPLSNDPVVKPLKDFKNPYIAAEIFNMVEDKRIDEKMKEEYPGAGEFYKALYDKTGEEVAASLSEAPTTRFNSIKQFIDNEVQMRRAGTPEQAAEVANIAREFLLYRTCGIALMNVQGLINADMTTGVDECDAMSTRVANEVREAIDPDKTNEDIVDLTLATLRILDPLIPDKQFSKDKAGGSEAEIGQGAGSGKGKNGKGEKDANGNPIPGGAHGHSHDVKGQMDKMAYGKPPGRTSSPFDNQIYNQFSRADERVRGIGDVLKRKLIAVMRDNDHQRFDGNQKRGHLQKKLLSRVALDRYRIYQKRIEKKGKKYAVAIVEDCSGSMFSGQTGGASEQAHEAVALFTRVFRALGFPSSVTIFGTEAKTVLSPREPYIVQKVNDRMETSNGNYYRAGGTELSNGIREGLKQLQAVGQGRHKLLVVITDASLAGSDRAMCQNLLQKEMRNKDFSPMLYFVNSDESVLGDDRYEARIDDVNTDMVPAATRLMKKVIAPMQWQ